MPETPAARLRERLRRAGPIPFAAFMEEALYGRGGYYDREDPRIGEAGDYVTGSSLSPLFGRATARLLRRLDRALGRPAEIFEAGYGTGAHLAAVRAALGERAGERAARAWDRVPRPVPEGVEVVGAPEEIGAASVEGLIFSYELFDALPVHRLLRRGGETRELWVELDGEGRPGWREGELSDPALEELLAELTARAGVEPEEGQIVDLAPGWPPLYRRLASRLGRGLMVTCDYGFEAPRLLDPRVRRHGTLACYRRQTVHRDPFVDVGEQDLTAHVDFSTLIAAGEAEGLATVAFTRQALWLTACGLFEDLDGASPQVRQQAMALLDPQGMGEDIRVLVQARGVDPAALFDPALLGLSAGR